MTKKFKFQNSKSEQKSAKFLIFRVKLKIFIIFKFITPKIFGTLFLYIIYHEKNFFEKKTKNDKKKLSQKCVILEKNSQKL